MENRKILISGTGIAGPCLAYWLLRYGFEPTLVERAPALRTGGYIIDFWGLGFEVAEKMGLVPGLRRDRYDIQEVRIVDDRGRRTGGFGAQRALRAVLGDRYLSVLRSDLSRRLYESVDGKVRTIFGDSIAAIAQNEHGVKVTFLHAPPEQYDLVIGAGGLHSQVRRLVFGPEAQYERYLGYYAASFMVRDYPHRDPDVYVSYAAPGRQLSRFSLRDAWTVFFFAFASDAVLSPPPSDPEAQKQVLREVFGRDGWEGPQILAALDDCEDLYFDPVSQIEMPSWAKGRVALVGDACACPSLLAGQGSALAMAEAYVLAGELKRANGDYGVAFQSYERLLHPLMPAKQRGAKDFATSFAPKTRFGIFVRNQVMHFMTLPQVAKLFMGRLLTDPLVLPDYAT